LVSFEEFLLCGIEAESSSILKQYQSPALRRPEKPLDRMKRPENRRKGKKAKNASKSKDGNKNHFRPISKQPSARMTSKHGFPE